MTATMTRKETLTVVCGEPSPDIGGGTPAVALEVTIDRGLARATAHVLYVDGGCLGQVMSDHVRRPIRAGDELSMQFRDLPALDLIDQHYGFGHEWRIVTADAPWWNGREFCPPRTAVQS